MNLKNALLALLFTLIGFSLTSAQNKALPDELEAYLEKQNINTFSTDYGLYYFIEEKGSGPKPQTGDYISIQFKGKLLDGTLFDESDPQDPFIFQIGYRQVIRGWDLGLKEFPVGSKGTLYIPPNLGYGTRGAGEKIPPNAPLIFDVEVVKILTEKEYDAYMTALEEKEQATYQAAKNTQFLTDKRLIQEYTLTHKLRTKRTQTGLSYTITKKGSGEKAKPGDKLEVSYQGFLLNGEPFDATTAQETYTFQLGMGKVIKGWEEGLQFFNEGSEGVLLIPSQLAYGPRAIYEKNISIPANSVLVFKIKVEKIKAAEPN